MIEAEWRADVEAAVVGTEWAVESVAVTQGFPYAVAALKHVGTQETRIVQVSLATALSKAYQKTEILKQLL